jgi:hypothetical protein
MADVFTVLSQDHQEVKGMLAELEKGPTRATGASEDQLALRKKMTEQLIIEESKHEALEEMYFWPAVPSLGDPDAVPQQNGCFNTLEMTEAQWFVIGVNELPADGALHDGNGVDR